MHGQKKNIAIKPCSCKHEFQDKKYGQGMRVMNRCKQVDDKSTKFRCTICSRET